MSDGFDKEAERERLREKYEKDQEDREATERMSELLLQGATMTNKHCDSCGTPIFRYEGQEFCPTCQVVTRESEEAHSTGTDSAADTAVEGTGTAAQAHGADAQESETAAQEPGADAQEPETAAQAPESAGEGSGRAEQSPASRTDRPDAGTTDGAETEPAGENDTAAVGTGSERQDSESGKGTVAGEATAADTTQVRSAESTERPSFEETTATLLETITTLSRRAAREDEPRRAKELLAAAREAAETLEAVREAT
ncbi:MAG: Sjogren's syndrome/scleroderma autoantigen 1 family protein [Halodesulfurarchaeum sp.]